MVWCVRTTGLLPEFAVQNEWFKRNDRKTHQTTNYDFRRPSSGRISRNVYLFDRDSPSGHYVQVPVAVLADDMLLDCRKDHLGIGVFGQPQHGPGQLGPVRKLPDLRPSVRLRGQRILLLCSGT
jgi:hypothetical protein